MVSCALAITHSLGGIFHSFAARFKNSGSMLTDESHPSVESNPQTNGWACPGFVEG
jgi:hypothetical protein